MISRRDVWDIPADVCDILADVCDIRTDVCDIPADVCDIPSDVCDILADVCDILAEKITKSNISVKIRDIKERIMSVPIFVWSSITIKQSL